MVRARLSLTQALDTAIRQCEYKSFKKILADVKEQVQNGRSLADSFDKHHDVFDALYVSLIRVGELGGIMDVVLLRIAAYHEKSDGLRRKIRQALAYPAVVLVVAFAATMFLLTHIVPTFAGMFADFGAQLPAPTRLILALSTISKDYAGVIFLLIILLGSVVSSIRNKPGMRVVIDRIKLVMPLSGNLIRKNLAARFCRTLGALLESGVSLIEALEMLGKSTGNKYLDREIEVITRKVSQGKSLAMEVGKIDLFPELVVQMIIIGEKTAELDQMLIYAAEYYEAEVEAMLEGISSILEPILIVLIGLIMGGILVALYLPMFDLVNVIG